MKKYLVFLLFTLSIFSAYGIDWETIRQKLKEEGHQFADAATIYVDKLNAERDALEEKFKVVVHGEVDGFTYKGKDKNKIKVNGFYVHDFNETGDEYFVPLTTTFKNGLSEVEYTLDYEDNVFKDKHIFLAFSRNNKWYVGEFFISPSWNNMPNMQVLEVNSLDEAVDILVEMFTVHAYMSVNYAKYGFKNPARIEENITYMDSNNVDWDSMYSFEMVVPIDLVNYWGYSFCNAYVSVTKFNRLNGELINPYNWYVEHPLSLCDAMECTAGGMYKYVVAPLGSHKVDGMFYNKNHFKSLPIVDTTSHWSLDTFEK